MKRGRWEVQYTGRLGVGVVHLSNVAEFFGRDILFEVRSGPTTRHGA